MQVTFEGEESFKKELRELNAGEKTPAKRKKATNLKKILDKLQELRNEILPRSK
jgi:hypothetical protein